MWLFKRRLLMRQEHDTRIRSAMPLNPTAEELGPV